MQPCDLGTAIERADGDGRVSGSGTKVSPLFLATHICSHVSLDWEIGAFQKSQSERYGLVTEE